MTAGAAVMWQEDKSAGLVRRIHEDALTVLAEAGVHCRSPEVRNLFADTGLAALDETSGNIHVLPELVSQALSLAPGRSEFWVPADSFGIGGTAPFVYDDDLGDLITPTFGHLETIATAAQEADCVSFMARGVLLPKREAEVMETMIARCRKPIYVAAVTPEGIARAGEIARSRSGLVVQFSIITSPLTVMESMIPPFLSCVKNNTPVYLSTMPMAGLTGPYSMSSLVTLTHAEALFGITLAQLLHPGITVVHAGLPSITDISKSYALDMGSAAHNLANLLMAKVGESLDLPSIQTACTTNAERPGLQAERDACLGFSLCKRHGFHQMRHCFGFLKDLVGFSIKKLRRGIEICMEATAEDSPPYHFEAYDPEGLAAILRNGSRAGYRSDPHTLKNVGERFTSA
ncbi:MAG: trimethylamine methyltransferase family protein [Thermodesulfobacteriota bacterium]